jgi:SH3 domain protein
MSILAKTQYITDSFEITLRNSASNSAKIIAMPKSGDPVTIIGGDGEWLNIRMNATDKKGWVLKRYITPRVPFEKQLNYVNTKHKVFKDSVKTLLNTIAELRNEKLSLKKELNSTKSELDNVEKRYTSLYDGSSDYLGLQAEFDSIGVKYEREHEKNSELTIENAQLRINVRNRWFLTGALVVFLSYLLGRSSRKNKSTRRF